MIGLLNWQIRIVLFVGSVLSFFIVVRNIKKRKIRMEDGTFWIVIGFMLVILSIFPQIAVWLAGVFGVQSASNFVFLLVIFLLGAHQFTLSIKISGLNVKLSELVQNEAVTDMLERESAKKEKETGEIEEIGEMREAAAARDAGGEYL